MLRNLCKIPTRKNYFSVFIQKQTFLTNDYKCTEAWNTQISSSLLKKINLSDFYNALEQNYTSKGVISAIDVDIFANAIRDPMYLDELKDILHKLRLSAETGNILESTHYATIRNFIEFGNIQDLVDILKDPLNFGIFLDDFTANILLDKLLISEDYELAANVAALIMLQEEYTNDITCTLCQYACYKFISNYSPPVESTSPPEEKNKKVEEIKIRVKFLRNPYFDDHFDIKDLATLSGKTLAWISENKSDNLNINLQIIGWLFYKKYDKLLTLCEKFASSQLSKVYNEVLGILQEASNTAQEESKAQLKKCVSILGGINKAEISLEETLKNHIENAINKSQSKDIITQQQLFNLWTKIREEKLEEQTQRLDRVRRMQQIQEKQSKLKEEEQKLWFFDNEEQIDLEIEEKEKLVEKTSGKRTSITADVENYIPPEILPKRK